MYNNPLKSIWIRLKLFQYRQANSLFVKPPKLDLRCSYRNRFFFDFSDDKYTHLGDILFYLPLILFLQKKKEFYVAVQINPVRESFMNFLLSSLDSMVDLYVIESALDLPSEGIIISSPYKLFDYKSSKLCIVGLGNPHQVIDLKYPIYLANVFLSNFLHFDDNTELVHDGFEVWRNNFCKALGNIRGSFKRDLLWVSPFIASGKFRDFLGRKKDAIIKFVKQKINADNLDFALIGSALDRSFTFESDARVDFRGRNLVELMILANSDSVKAGVGFDNFWMHFFDIIGKPYYVKFRGRFLKSQYDLHCKSINVSFLRSGARVYI